MNNARILEKEGLAGGIQRVGHMSTQRTWWQSLDVKQRLKLAVYALLLVNFAHYIGNDIEQAQHTFHPDGAGTTGPVTSPPRWTSLVGSSCFSSSSCRLTYYQTMLLRAVASWR